MTSGESTLAFPWRIRQSIRLSQIGSSSYRHFHGPQSQRREMRNQRQHHVWSCQIPCLDRLDHYRAFALGRGCDGSDTRVARKLRPLSGVLREIACAVANLKLSAGLEILMSWPRNLERRPTGPVRPAITKHFAQAPLLSARSRQSGIHMWSMQSSCVRSRDCRAALPRGETFFYFLHSLLVHFPFCSSTHHSASFFSVVVWCRRITVVVCACLETVGSCWVRRVAFTTRAAPQCLRSMQSTRMLSWSTTRI
jgi:hypothetical protein